MLRKALPNHRKRILSSLLGLLLTTTLALGSAAPSKRPATGHPPAQTITGQVIDLSTDEPLPGVNVLAKGTTTGTVTDVEGNYRLTVDDAVTTLVYSSIGFETVEEAINGRSTINLSLAPDIQSLSEVVVVGYGTQRREDLTGSIASVSGEELTNLTVSSFDQALQGKVAGVQVNQNSAAPGGGLNINIRGLNTFNGNTQPLYVIDGIPVIANNNAIAGGDRRGVGTNPMAMLNPNEIESIDILKDASATAIYGSRGANGVVIITTKRGKSGAPRIDVNASVGVQTGLRQYDLLETPQYVNWANLSARVTGGEIKYTPEDSLRAIQTNTDWQDEILNPGALVQDYQVTFSGGSENTKYAVVAGVFNQEGIVKSSNFRRYSIRSNLDKAVTDRISIGHNLSFSRITTDAVIAEVNAGLEGPVNTALIWRPDIPVYIDSLNRYGDITEDGPANVLSEGKEENPVAALEEIDNRLTTDRFLGSLYADWEFVEGLTLRSTLNADISRSDRNVYYNTTTALGNERGGLAGLYSRRFNALVNENTLSYNKDLGNSQISAVVGYTIQQNTVENQNMENTGFDVEVNRALGIASGTGVPSLNVFKNKEVLASYLGRVNYNLLGRYLFTFTARADGSSKFSADNKWGFFPAGAVGWTVSEEPFMAEVPAISNLKLRASLGVSGFQEVSPYQTLASYDNENYAFGGREVPGYFVSSPEIPGVGWQETKQTNVGVDLGLWNNRLSMTADYYIKETTDLLFNRPVPNSTGYGSIFGNIGAMDNEGFEFSLNATVVTTPNLSWTLSGNVSTNRVTVQEIGDVEQFFARGINNRRNVLLVEEGLAPGLFYGYRTDGVFDDEQDVDTWANGAQANDSEPGERRYVDVDGDSAITTSDLTVIGNPYPDFIYGLTSNLTFRGFTLNLFFQGSQGNDVLNVNRARLYDDGANKNVTVDRYENRWTPQNPTAPYPRASAQSINNDYMEDWVVEDGSFLRLRSLNLGYTVPLPDATLRSLRINLRVDNVFTITNYSGYNPDVNSQSSAAQFARGIDFGGYPLPRIYTVGVNLGI